jgi:hypothetical protein
VAVDGSDDRLRTFQQAGGIILDREIHRDRFAPSPAELCLDQVPVPADVSGAVNESVGGHGPTASCTICARGCRL